MGGGGGGSPRPNLILHFRPCTENVVCKVLVAKSAIVLHVELGQGLLVAEDRACEMTQWRGGQLGRKQINWRKLIMLRVYASRKRCISCSFKGNRQRLGAGLSSETDSFQCHSRMNGKWPTNEEGHAKPNKAWSEHGVRSPIFTYQESTVQYFWRSPWTFFKLEITAFVIKLEDSTSACEWVAWVCDCHFVFITT